VDQLDEAIAKGTEAWADVRDPAAWLEGVRGGEAQAGADDAVIEAAAKYGWQHASWDWENVRGGLDRFRRPKPAEGGEQYIRFDYEDGEGRPQCKMITHEEMRQRYAELFLQKNVMFAKPAEGGAVSFDDVCAVIRSYGEQCIALGRESAPAGSGEAVAVLTVEADGSIYASPNINAERMPAGEYKLYAGAPPAASQGDSWTDEQCREFARIAFRHARCNLPKHVELNDIRMGAEFARRLAGGEGE
jgi:hypothetical protein